MKSPIFNLQSARRALTLLLALAAINQLPTPPAASAAVDGTALSSVMYSRTNNIITDATTFNLICAGGSTATVSTAGITFNGTPLLRSGLITINGVALTNGAALTVTDASSITNATYNMTTNSAGVGSAILDGRTIQITVGTNQTGSTGGITNFAGTGGLTVSNDGTNVTYGTDGSIVQTGAMVSAINGTNDAIRSQANTNNATLAQGALADSAVQPAALGGYIPTNAAPMFGADGSLVITQRFLAPPESGREYSWGIGTNFANESFCAGPILDRTTTNRSATGITFSYLGTMMAEIGMDTRTPPQYFVVCHINGEGDVINVSTNGNVSLYVSPPYDTAHFGIEAKTSVWSAVKLVSPSGVDSLHLCSLYSATNVGAGISWRKGTGTEYWRLDTDPARIGSTNFVLRSMRESGKAYFLAEPGNVKFGTNALSDISSVTVTGNITAASFTGALNGTATNSSAIENVPLSGLVQSSQLSTAAVGSAATAGYLTRTNYTAGMVWRTQGVPLTTSGSITAGNTLLPSANATYGCRVTSGADQATASWQLDLPVGATSAVCVATVIATNATTCYVRPNRFLWCSDVGGTNTETVGVSTNSVYSLVAGYNYLTNSCSITPGAAVYQYQIFFKTNDPASTLWYTGSTVTFQ
jgi:hypothetical protein